MINRVILRGFVASDPFVRSTEKGRLAKFRLATIEYLTNPNSSQTMEHTEWHNLSCWGEIAEEVDLKVKIGMVVEVEGILRHREWQDQSGEVRKITEISIGKFAIIEGEVKGYRMPKAIVEAMPKEVITKSEVLEVTPPAEDPDNLPF